MTTSGPLEARQLRDRRVRQVLLQPPRRHTEAAPAADRTHLETRVGATWENTFD